MKRSQLQVTDQAHQIASWVKQIHGHRAWTEEGHENSVDGKNHESRGATSNWGEVRYVDRPGKMRNAVIFFQVRISFFCVYLYFSEVSIFFCVYLSFFYEEYLYFSECTYLFSMNIYLFLSTPIFFV